MKKVLFMAILICCTVFIIETINSANNAIKSETYSSTINNIYVIKEYKGSVAVFSGSSDLPVQVLDCKIKNLPPDAAEALATGIKVFGEDELQKYIEAYD